MLHIDSLAVWKIINEEDAVLIPENQGRRELFQGIFALGIFWGGVSCYAATPLIVALSLGQSDITGFVHGQQSRPTGNHLDHAEKRSGISGPT